MRFEECDTKYPVIYTPGDVESMRSALKKYTELIVSKVAFEDSYCVAHFVHYFEVYSSERKAVLNS